MPNHDHDLSQLAVPQLPALVSAEEAGAPVFKRALASVMDELLAMEPRRLMRVNVDIPAASRVVIGALPAIAALRPQMVARFGETDASAVDRLELLARAAAQAHTIHATTETGYDLRPLADEVSALRAALLAELSSLGARKRVVPSHIGQVHRRAGFKNVGFDVLRLVAFLTRHWPAIEGATGLTLAELERAEGLAHQLIKAASINAQPQPSRSADVRQRAYTLLYETYDDVRQMVGYLRWKQGDAELVAPSWFALRHRKRAGRSAAGARAESDAVPTEATPLTSAR